MCLSSISMNLNISNECHILDRFKIEVTAIIIEKKY
jgi:hypothetical protein